MDFVNEKLGCKFSLPDRPTVRQQLAFWSEFNEADGSGKFEGYFMAAYPLMTGWTCAALPDPTVDLDSIDNPKAASAIIWAGSQAVKFFNKLEELPKNA